MTKNLPIILFAICILIAVVLALSSMAYLPAALAIAMAGAALALALRVQTAAESDDLLIAEIAELRKSNTELRNEIRDSHSMIDELADVVEQIATVAAESDGASQDQLDALRLSLAEIQSAPPPADNVLSTAATDDRIGEVERRLSALEGETRERLDAHDATLSLTQIAPPENTLSPGLAAPAAPAQIMAAPTEPALQDTRPAEPSTEARTEEATGNLRSLIARAGGTMPTTAAAAAAGTVAATASARASALHGGGETADMDGTVATGDDAQASEPASALNTAPETANAPDPAAHTGTKATLAPVFEPELGTPVAFILSAADAQKDENVSGLLDHAKQICNELEEAGREILLFLRLAPHALEPLTVRREILAAVDSVPALQRRLTMLTAQDGFNASVHNTLMAIADRGCRFALEDVRDWSLDLEGLAKSGLRFIAVDALAMANSAVEQGGDPRRLAQALAAHDIALIGGSVSRKEDIDAVRGLEPALVTGNGLGEPRVVEPAA